MTKQEKTKADAVRARAALALARGAIEALATLGVDRRKLMQLLPTILEDISDPKAFDAELFHLPEGAYFRDTTPQNREDDKTC